MQLQIILLLLLAHGRSLLAVPVNLQSPTLRQAVIRCMDSQQDEIVKWPDFIACIRSDFDTTGKVKLLPGVFLIADKVAVEEGRALQPHHTLQVKLPWNKWMSNWLGGWNDPSLILKGNTSSVDLSMQLSKSSDEVEGRGKKLHKLFLPLLIGLKFKTAFVNMLSYGAVVALASKALLVSFASIIISIILAVRKSQQSNEVGTIHAIASPYSTYEPYHHRSYESLASGSISPITFESSSNFIPSAVDPLAYRGYNNKV